MNLVLAIVWFVVGMVLLAMAWERPGFLEERWGPGYLPGLAALGMCLYNLVRWRLARPRSRSQEPIIPKRLPRTRAEGEHQFRLEDQPIQLPPQEK